MSLIDLKTLLFQLSLSYRQAYRTLTCVCVTPSSQHGEISLVSISLLKPKDLGSDDKDKRLIHRVELLDLGCVCGVWYCLCVFLAVGWELCCNCSRVSYLLSFLKKKTPENELQEASLTETLINLSFESRVILVL